MPLEIDHPFVEAARDYVYATATRQTKRLDIVNSVAAHLGHRRGGAVSNINESEVPAAARFIISQDAKSGRYFAKFDR